MPVVIHDLQYDSLLVLITGKL